MESIVLAARMDRGSVLFWVMRGGQTRSRRRRRRGSENEMAAAA